MLELYSFPFSAMASACNVHLFSDNRIKAESAAQAAIGEVSRIEQRFSRYRHDNILAEINDAGRRSASVTVDEETARLIDYAFAAYKHSDGLFDITSGVLRQVWDFKSGRLPDRKSVDDLLPLIGLSKLVWQRPRLTFPIPGMELDFGGLGKEYAADQAKAICTSLGICHGLVDLGGDIAIIGPQPNGTGWDIGIRDPRSTNTRITSLSVDCGALASSGDYERFMVADGRRYCHILNPMTGWSCRGLAAVSVSAGECLVAGTISTIAMLKGRDAIQWLAQLGFKYFYVEESGACGGNFQMSQPEAKDLDQ